MDAAQFRTTKFSLAAAALFLIGGAAAQAQSFIFPNGTSVTLQGQAGGSLTVQSSAASIAFTTSTVYNATDNPRNVAWLTVNNGPSFAGSTNTTGITLFFQIGGLVGQLPAGVHSATVNLTATDGSGATGSINVTYDTGSQPGGGGTGGGITASPASLSAFATTAQSNVPFTLNTSSSSPISFTVSTATSAPWLTVSPPLGTVTSGTATNLTATFNPTGLGLACYTANIVISYASTTLSIPVSYGVGVSCNGGTTGTGTLIANPTQIPWGFTTNGSAPGAQFISLSSTGSATTYNATVSTSNNWLQINGATSGVALSAGLTLSPTQNIYSLPTGQYVGTVNITANDGSTATVTVTLTVNGSTSTGLNFSPNPINFSALLNGSAVTQQVTVTSAVAGPITAQVQGSGLTLLSLSSASITQNGSVTITIAGNPAGLSAQTVSGSLTVTVNGSTNSQLSDQINFTVGTPSTGGGGGGTTTTALAPSTINFAYQTGSIMPSTLVQQVYLGGTDTFQVSYPAGQSWITVSPSSGVAPGVVNVTVNARGLPAGANAGSVTFTGASSTLTLTVNVQVSGSPVLYSGGAYGDLYFGYVVGSSAGTVSNSLLIYASDSSAIPMTAAVTNPSATPWLSISSSAITQSPESPATFTVSVTPTNLTNGVYQGSITVTSNAANNPLIVPVVLVVSGFVQSGGLTLSSSSITFPQVQVNGVAPAAAQLTVSAATPTSFTAQVGTSTNTCSWLSISPSGVLTTPQTLSVSANLTGLTALTYACPINLTVNGSTQSVNVTLPVGTTVGGGNLTVTANGGANSAPILSFTSTAGGAVAQQFLSISSASGAAAVSFSVSTTTTDGNAWLQTGAVPGVTLQTPYTLTVSINVGNLGAGSYNGAITITPTGGQQVSIPVNLTVTGAPTASVSATPLSFAFQVGQGPPASQTIQVTAANASGTVTFAAQATSSGWLSVSPTTGTAPGSITVSINTQNLTAAGSLTGSITVTGTNGAGGSTTIPVTITVTAPLPTITSVVNSATSLAGPVAPGEIVSIYGTFMGPTTGVTLTLLNGKVSTNIGGVQVLVGGFAAPLIFVSANQINAVVPYEAANLLNPSVLVLYLGQSSNGFNLNRASSIPGIFTANASGSGPGAILNGDNSPNTQSNPAARGSIVQVYLTGEGITSPAGVTGSVTTFTTVSALPAPVLPVAVLVANSPAATTFVGEAPGLVAGVLQVNVQIPTTLPLPAGVSVFNAPISIAVGANGSQPNVTVWVK